MREIITCVEMAEAILDNVHSQFGVRIGLGNAVRDEAAAARGAAEQAYPEIWYQLDAAREAAKRAGKDVSRYDALRPPQLILDDAGLRAARDAISVFRETLAKPSWSLPSSQGVPNVRNGTTIATVIIVAVVIALLALR